MFFDGRCAFGQVGAAQSHLANQGVGVGDIFLFFGLFCDEGSREAHHRIFGQMRVEQAIHLGSKPTPFSIGRTDRLHPHLQGEWPDNNTLYVGAGATCRQAPPELRLTREGGPVSMWRVPAWLSQFGLSYHGKPERWIGATQLQSAARGQEFVSDVGDDPDALDWVRRIEAAIRA